MVGGRPEGRVAGGPGGGAQAAVGRRARRQAAGQHHEIMFSPSFFQIQSLSCIIVTTIKMDRDDTVSISLVQLQLVCLSPKLTGIMVQGCHFC